MLKPLKLKGFTTNEIKPTGWLKRQLEIQANGLSGNLDKIWPDIKDSKWIGGDKEGWERVPYWLDGFIPLAYLLDDADMKARAKKYIDAIIERQKEDGWICPCEDAERGKYDMWALHLICKVLVLYYECSGDQRIEQAVYRALLSFRKHINRYTLFDWGATRWYECLIPIYWLYERRREDWLLDLAKLLYVQGTDYPKLFKTLDMKRSPDFPHWSYLDHIVNMAMAIKSEGLYSRVSGEDPNSFAKLMLNRLMTDHGTVYGHFNGDECLSGTSPIAGTECCGVVEAMYSYEHLLSLTGDASWGDLIEVLAFNALPATLTPDMWGHQYDQMTNQVECIKIPKEDIHFISNGGESHLFGLEPNFGCCTANFNQGYPKFALSAFMQSNDGIAVTLITPAKLNTSVNGVNVEIKTDTLYPFKGTAVITVKPQQAVSFGLSVRIPSCAAAARINGTPVTPGEFFTITREWNKEETVSLEMEFKTELLHRPSGMAAVKRGPLVYSVAIAEEWHRLEFIRADVERKFPYCDYEIHAKSKWNYAFASDSFTVNEFDVLDMPFSPQQAPVTLTAKLVEIPWSKKNGVCSEKPDSLTPISEPYDVKLIPYGCTNIRMTEMPCLF